MQGRAPIQSLAGAVWYSASLLPSKFKSFTVKVCSYLHDTSKFHLSLMNFVHARESNSKFKSFTVNVCSYLHDTSKFHLSLMNFVHARESNQLMPHLAHLFVDLSNYMKRNGDIADQTKGRGTVKLL